MFWNLAMYGSDMLFVENDFGPLQHRQHYGWFKKDAGLPDDPDPKEPPSRYL